VIPPGTRTPTQVPLTSYCLGSPAYLEPPQGYSLVRNCNAQPCSEYAWAGFNHTDRFGFPFATKCIIDFHLYGSDGNSRDWTECSATCGQGTQTAATVCMVRCISESLRGTIIHNLRDALFLYHSQDKTTGEIQLDSVCEANGVPKPSSLRDCTATCGGGGTCIQNECQCVSPYFGRRCE
jgi:hypothetical protein